MTNDQSLKLNRRDLLKWSGAALAGGAALVGASQRAEAQSGSLSCGGGQIIEVFPSSPFILNPFKDALPVPTPLTQVSDGELSTWAVKPMTTGCQDSYGSDHQCLPGQLGLPKPVIYNIKLQVASHSFTSSAVMPLKDVVINGVKKYSAGSTVAQLPNSTIYGFNGQFPGPMIYARYGQPCLVRFENHLEENPYNLDTQNFGVPEFLTHLHNGHTACESDGNPNYKSTVNARKGAAENTGYRQGEYVDNLYLNYPAGNDPCEVQSFFWFHDHRMDMTGANVYKGMVGLFPIYDPINDSGDETKGYHLPGVPDPTSGRVKYDIPLAFYDCRLDDGVTPHKDFHNGCGETHPEWWGKTFFRHFPDHGFVGDIFTVNGTAYPVLNVDRRRYRFRLLTASISRCYGLKFMKGGTPVAAPGTDGQWQLPNGAQCMQFHEIAVDGGLLPKAVLKDQVDVWPAKRREIVVDFSRYIDGSPTQPGDVIYMVNVMKMSTGRMPDSPDAKYKVPMIKIVIGDTVTDNSVDFFKAPNTPLRALPPLPANMSSLPQRNFTFQRGSAGGEIQWLVNGKPFDPTVQMAYVKQGQPECWTITNGGGGWVHPIHFHMEEHHTLSRTGGMQPEDNSREDVVAIGPAETVVFYRNFRTFTGRYVAHCHNLAHEDHAMMFGWEILP